MFYNDILHKTGVQTPPGAGRCPRNPQPYAFYGENNAYQPPGVSWSWHPPPSASGGYPYFGDNEWIEIGHKKDPYGDEHFGMWMLYAKGSAVWYNIGRSKNFRHHIQAFDYWGLRRTGASNEPMCRAACSDGFTSVQFSA